MSDCIFCKIINKEIPTDFLYEDDLVVAFKDIQPIAPVHILIIPKKHVVSANDLEDEKLAGRLIIIGRKLAKELGTAEGGYKLLIRTGKDGGQEVPHLHLHLLGGGPLKEIIGPR